MTFDELFNQPLTKEFLEELLLAGHARITPMTWPPITGDFKTPMIPAGMARKQRIRALEKTAGDTGLTDRLRHQAWDEAGRLKAVNKKASERRHERIDKATTLVEDAKVTLAEVKRWQEQGGRD